MKAWGKSLSIDIIDCIHEELTDEVVIRLFVKEIIREIGMRAHGPCYIDRFGDGTLEGISALQFIETSSITVHCDEQEDRVFIDIFSCKDFDEKKAKAFCEAYFGGHCNQEKVFERGI